MGLFPARAMERAMKVQEVILRAMSGQIKWFEAAEILGMSQRSMRRWRMRMGKQGYEGLFDRRTRRPSPKRVALELAEKVLHLYREKYFDFNVKHFHETLEREHGIRLSYTWVKAALQTAGLVSRRNKRGDGSLGVIGDGASFFSSGGHWGSLGTELLFSPLGSR